MIESKGKDPRLKAPTTMDRIPVEADLRKRYQETTEVELRVHRDMIALPRYQRICLLITNTSQTMIKLAR